MVKIDQTKQVFVAYPYTMYDKRLYRRAYERAGAEYGVNFFFADERITNMHILQKIQRQILISDFSIFDISGWNPNVSLELGMAYASANVSWYICYNPAKNARQDVPSDLRGLDRIEYRNLPELQDKLIVLLEQKYPGRRGEPPLQDYEADMREKVVAVLRNATAGLQLAEIANALKCSRGMASVLVAGLVKSKKVKATAAKKGKRYFLSD